MKVRAHQLASCILVAVAAVVAGCNAGRDRDKQLQSVASQWSKTIRASQVIPVYPLTEDLQPGDVFVVQVPIARQQDVWDKEGYLPLDQAGFRLTGLDFKEYYKDLYLRGWTTLDQPPYDRPIPGQPTTDAAVRFGDAPLPRAAFPTFSFEVQSGTAGNFRFPIEGVPVGLSLMGADRAWGAVTIADAFTYGIDTEQAIRHLNEWLSEDIQRRRLLRDVAQQTEERLYLRVVTRVYLAGGVFITMNRMRTAGGGADVGASEAMALPDLSGKSADEVKSLSESYSAMAEAHGKLLNTLSENLPGGSLRIAHVSRGSVSMEQNFDRLLVIGYNGFDVPVYENGDLGAPIPTFERFEHGFAEPPARTAESPLSPAEVALQWRLDTIALLAESQKSEDRELARTRISNIAQQLPSEQFAPITDAAAEATDVQELARAFSEAIGTYISQDREDARKRRVIRAFDESLQEVR